MGTEQLCTISAPFGSSVNIGTQLPTAGPIIESTRLCGRG